MKRIVLFVALLPVFASAQKSYHYAFFGAETFSGSKESTRYGVSTSFGWGINKFMTLGFGGSGYLIDDGYRYGTVRLDATYFILGIDQKVTPLVSLQPGYVIAPKTGYLDRYNNQQIKTGAACLEVLGGVKTNFYKHVGIYAAAGYSVTQFKMVHGYFNDAGFKAKVGISL
ncbi:MAG TPA: hypothetical protein VG870_10970 [Chitinophagaceae bacterium]|nr:hypothetical protein [Chitinophagaceae bacterium]